MKKVGQSLPRSDGKAKVTGTARYVDDIQPEGCLHGATLRSPYPNARILSITLDPDYDWSEITVVTAKDIPGENTIYLMTKDQPALADKIALHAAEAVALVAAPTKAQAKEALKHIHVEYERLPALLDMTQSIGHPDPIYGEDNIFKHILLEKGDVDNVHEGILVEGEYRVGRQEQVYLEPQGMLATPREDGGITITGSMQCPYYIVKALIPMLGHNKLNVIQATTGGGFGGKEEYPSMIAAHAALLALKAQKPVKLIYERDEDMLATTKRHPAIIKIATRVTEEGKLLSIKADILMDAGAYNTLTPVVLSRAILHCTGPYRCDNVRLDGKAVATHNPPHGAFRGFGVPQSQFAIERHMDNIARTLSIDPIELRRRNILLDGDTTATGQRLEKPAAKQVLEAVLNAAQKPLPPVPPRLGTLEEFSRVAKGRGLSLVFHGCGFTGNGEAFIKGRVGLILHHDKVHILTSSVDIGQGLDTILPQIVAEELDIPLSRIIMDPHDTQHVPDSGPTVASRTTMVVGKVAQEAAQKLKDALAKEVGSTGSFEELLAQRKATTALAIEHEYHADEQEWDPETHQGAAYPTYGWNATLVDLAVDLDTGEVHYERVITATDVGVAINPTLASGQIEGGTLQALGWATTEEVIIDENGLMANNSLSNYIIPTALDAPYMETILVENPFEGGPFGAKGIGEIPMDGPAAAVAQAVERATGVVIDDLPLSPEKILTKLENSSL